MAGVTFTVVGVNAFEAEMKARGAVFDREIENAVGHHGKKMLNVVRDMASHRPGPQVITGRHVASIRLRTSQTGKAFHAEVFSDNDYAHRLEYGFVGVDNQGNPEYSRPYPHFRPGLEQVGAEFRDFLHRKYGG